MDIPAHILEDLKCIRCNVYLCRGPVYLQHDAAALCGRCYTPQCRAVRNQLYEATAKLLKFPCKNRDLGCLATVPFVHENESIAHEEVCEHRQYVCPVLGSAHCDRLGARRDFLQHCSDQHPDTVVDSPVTLVHDITKASAQTYLLRAFEILFLLHTKVCLVSGKLFHAVRFLGASAEATNYDFTLDIKRGIEQLTKVGQVASQGCLAIQEPISLPVTTNSLLDVLGGFDGTTFTVTIKRKMIRCKICSNYSEPRGWQCERCFGYNKACKNQECTFTDIHPKRWKHEYFFCQQRTTCVICWVNVPLGSLSAHHGSVHQDITYRSGSTWRATLSTRTSRQRCLVTCAAGTAMCWYRLDDTEFVLRVYLPVSAELLGKFRCEVRVTNFVTEQTLTFTPAIAYFEWFDWRISVKKVELLPWNSQLNVSVNVIQSDS